MGVVRQRFFSNHRAFFGALTSIIVLVGSQMASAETFESALARAYGSNPNLNAQRATVRATDENVPRAKAGYRPEISATADVGGVFTEFERDAAPNGFGGVSRNNSTVTRTMPRGAGLQVNQTIFNGFRTDNSVRQAESSVLSARETLRNDEQNVLFDAASSYMNVLRDTAILNLQRNNVEVIEEQLRQTQDRFNVGEVTRTDVAQAEARLAGARSQASLAEANLRTSIARFRQNVGVEPRELAPGRPLDRLLPRSLDLALKVAFNEHPAIQAALHSVDVAELQVKVTQGELAPQLGVSGSVARRFDNQSPGDQANSASIVARLTVPIYEGGEVYARTRQAKETAGQRRLEADAVRDQVRAASHLLLGTAGGRAGPNRCSPVSGPGSRNRAERRSRRGSRRPADDSRRPERATGAIERSRQPDHRSTGSGRGLLCGGPGQRAIVVARPRAGGRALQREDPLRSGEGRLGRSHDS